MRAYTEYFEMGEFHYIHSEMAQIAITVKKDCGVQVIGNHGIQVRTNEGNTWWGWQFVPDKGDHGFFWVYTDDQRVMSKAESLNWMRSTAESDGDDTVIIPPDGRWHAVAYKY